MPPGTASRKYPLQPRPQGGEDLFHGGGQGGGAGAVEGDAPAKELQAGAGGCVHQQGQGHPQGDGPAAQGQRPADQATSAHCHLRPSASKYTTNTPQALAGYENTGPLPV